MSRQLELDPVLVRPLRRPDPLPEKKRKKREKTSLQARPQVIRLAVGLVAIAATTAFAGHIGTLAMAPVMATYRTGQEIQDLQRVKVSEAQVNAQLREDIGYLRTPAGIEQEARRRGWVKPGEVALSVVVAEPEGAGDAAEDAASRRPRSWSERIQEAVETCLAVLGGGRKNR